MRCRRRSVCPAEPDAPRFPIWQERWSSAGVGLLAQVTNSNGKRPEPYGRMKDVVRFVGLAILGADLYLMGLVVNVLAGDALAGRDGIKGNARPSLRRAFS